MAGSKWIAIKHEITQELDVRNKYNWKDNIASFLSAILSDYRNWIRLNMDYTCVYWETYSSVWRKFNYPEISLSSS